MFHCLLHCVFILILIFLAFISVIMPQLAATSAYTLQLLNENRRLDLATKLVDAFSAAIYCPLSKQTISTALLPGLR